MLNYSLYIVEDSGVFYFDVDEYNLKSDIPIENGDIIKFNYDGRKYTAKVINVSGIKNQSSILQILSK
jgi:hypothetical protein